MHKSLLQANFTFDIHKSLSSFTKLEYCNYTDKHQMCLN